MKALTRRRALVALSCGAIGVTVAERAIRAEAEGPRGDEVVLRRALREAAARALPEEGDAGAVMSLGDGRLLVEHRSLVLRQRRMPPGSVMKLVAAYALLEAGEADGEYVCRGEHEDALGVRRPCWLHAGHGPMRLRTALSSSCNAWFYEHTQRLDDAHLVDVLRRFGFGERFSTDLPAVSLDSVPAAIPRRDLPDVALGDDLSFQVTPLSLLRMTSIFATRGRRVTPVARAPSPAEVPQLSRPYLEIIAEGMTEAALGGTLKGVFGPHPVAAKTGTAKRPGEGHRGLVVGFLPVERPAFAFVVVKDRGKGGRDAGPAARLLVDALADAGALS